MNCAACGGPWTRVRETRRLENGTLTKRTRTCNCGAVFHTYEIPEGIWPTVRKWAVQSHAAALRKAHALRSRDAEIVRRVRRGEKRYLLAAEFGLADNSISHITRKAGIPPHQRFKKV